MGNTSNGIAAFMFEKTGMERLGKYLDVAGLRHKLIARNLANSSTPGFKSADIDFQEEFQRASGNGDFLAGTTTHPGHVAFGGHPSADPQINEQRVAGGDLNSVDAEKEISNLAQNELIYTVGAKLLKRKVEGIRKAITSE
ncbi:MAG: flagellar basal body rod protein FlgB [bacterium]